MQLKYRDDSKPNATFAIAVEGCSWASPDYYPLMVASSVGLPAGRGPPLAFPCRQHRARVTDDHGHPAPQIVGSWDRSFSGSLNMSSHLARACAQNKMALNFMSFNTAYTGEARLPGQHTAAAPHGRNRWGRHRPVGRLCGYPSRQD